MARTVSPMDDSKQYRSGQVNERAAAARDRKITTEAAKKAEAARIALDKEWEDPNKIIDNKLARRAQLDQAKQSAMLRKRENRALLAEEELAVTSQKGEAPKKVTRKQIANSQLLAAVAAKQRFESSKANVTADHTNVWGTANPNKSENQVADDIEDVMDFIEGTPKSDAHPEKRRMAAYKAYEAEWILKIQTESPGLKLSQIKERVSKKWQKAPENPMNQ
ncbi:MAG: uncharacterized protein KVP18_003531 [Porospora cf. gigantea A]|uniref:uncharacterized protein n=1 Tax=Porospora cf. gigantea A TaxID=2853593 RepID=UPI0035596190|nr:MAG: hypothetical protein KVP18_003531 [Porospora cf. gigantea A]